MSNLLNPAPQGAIINKKGSSRLYIKTYFFGKPFEYSIGVPDTPENRIELRGFLDRVMRKHRAGSLDFTEAFPAAKAEWKAFYAKKTGAYKNLRPEDVNVGMLLKELDAEVITLFSKKSVKDDYRNALNARLFDYFEDKTFADINVDGATSFAGTLFKVNGDPLSKSRIDKLLTPINFAVKFANSRYGWKLEPYPFWLIHKIMAFAERRERRVLTYPEWLSIINASNRLAPWYRPILEFMLMTGTIPSEIAAIKNSQTLLTARKLHVTHTIVDNLKKAGGKRSSRMRTITVAGSLVRVVEELLSQAGGDFLITMENGEIFNEDHFRNEVWKKILVAAEVEYTPPYSTRQTFFGWGLLMGIQPDILCRIGGHGSRRTLYDHYGKFVDSLEEHVAEIKVYLGDGFLGVKGRN